MPIINISNISFSFAKYSYTIDEIVDDILREKLDPDVREFCKEKLGINRIYKSYDLSNVEFNDSKYLAPDIKLNDLYAECAKKVLKSRQPDDIGLLTVINDNQQYLDPSPTVELGIRLGLKKDIRAQNFQGMACSSFSEALLNSAGHFSLGLEGNALVLIGTYYTNWFLDRIKQIDHISMANRDDFNNFIYFLIFSDVAAAALLSQADNQAMAQIDTKHICSRKDTTPDGFRKATVKLVQDKKFRMIFDMSVNSKILRECSAELSLENVLYLKEKFPSDYEKVKFWGLHSAGKIFVDYIRERCSIDPLKSKLTYDVMSETGNTGAASSLQMILESANRKILGQEDLGGIIDYGWEGANAFIYNL